MTFFVHFFDCRNIVFNNPHKIRHFFKFWQKNRHFAVYTPFFRLPPTGPQGILPRYNNGHSATGYDEEAYTSWFCLSESYPIYVLSGFTKQASHPMISFYGQFYGILAWNDEPDYYADCKHWITKKRGQNTRDDDANSFPVGIGIPDNACASNSLTMRREYSQQKIWWVGCAKMKRFQNYRIRNDDLRQPLVISKYLLYVIHTKSFRPKTTMEGGRYGEHGKGWGRRVTKNGSGRSVSACRPNGPCVIIITSAPMQKSYFYTLPFVPPRAFLDPHPHA